MPAELSGFLAVCAARVEREGLTGIDVLEIGVGKTAAAIGLTSALRDRDVAGVLLFGVGGAFRGSELGPGALCVVGQDGFGDEGVLTPTGFLDLAALGLGDVGPFVLPPELAEATAARLEAPVVRGVTVSTCSGTDSASAAMASRTGAAIETMEGAAVAQVCRAHTVPLVHVRAISNWTGDREQGEWDLPAAVQRVQRAVRALLVP